jgi:BirA family transcriptional regulator, biotin operon repressor / biotin---[acetyl-CoA-carboxylase] ligase
VSEKAQLPWNAQGLWAALSPLLPNLSVEVLARTDSTNTQLVERARRRGGLRDAPSSRPAELDSRLPGSDPSVGLVRTPHGRRSDDTQPVLLVAEQQTRGRGRQGRTWHSRAGASLTFSLSLPLAPVGWSGLSLALGLALADALDAPQAGQPPRIGLKWPNDLWLWEGPGQGRKLGGMLIETVAVGESRMCIVGIGLNVAPMALDADEASQGFACIQEFWPEATAPAVLGRIALPLARALRRFEAQGFAPLREGYARRDVLLGQTVVALTGERMGQAQGVAEDGSLLLKVQGVEAVQRVHSGELGLRPLPQAASA